MGIDSSEHEQQAPESAEWLSMRGFVDQHWAEAPPSPKNAWPSFSAALSGIEMFHLPVQTYHTTSELEMSARTPNCTPTPLPFTRQPSHYRATVEDAEDEDVVFISVMGPPIHSPNALLEYAGDESEGTHLSGVGVFNLSNNDEPTTHEDGVREVDQEADQDMPELSEGPIDDSDDESAQPMKSKGWKAPPTVQQLTDALVDLEKLLRPPRADKRRSYHDPDFDAKTVERLKAMKLLCFHALEQERTKPNSKQKTWISASLLTARALGHIKAGSKKPGTRKAEELRQWLRAFIED